MQSQDEAAAGHPRVARPRRIQSLAHQYKDAACKQAELSLYSEQELTEALAADQPARAAIGDAPWRRRPPPPCRS